MQQLHRILKPYKSDVLAAEALYRRAVATKVPSSVVKPWLCFSSHGFVQLSDVLAAAALFPLGRGGVLAAAALFCQAVAGF